MEWQGKKVLVTGAGGFIGSHMVERLVELGAQVTAQVRYNSKKEWGWLRSLPIHVKEAIKILPCDLAKEFPQSAEETDADTVFHLAAIMDTSPGYVTPKLVLENNHLCTLNALEAASKRASTFINISSFEVYGEPSILPTTEKEPCQVISPYAASKIAGEELVSTYSKIASFKAVNVRLFSTYGPRENVRRIIPTIVLQALKNEAVRLGTMDTQRDFVYISDAVEGMIKLAEADLSNFEGAVAVNLGSGEAVTIGDLADKVGEILNRKVKVTFDPRRIRLGGEDIPFSHADIGRLEDLTGWSPTVGLGRGLKDTIAWISSWVSHIESKSIW